MPLDYGCRLDQHHGVQGLRPNPVEPYPENPVCAEEPKPAWPLSPQHHYLMSKGDELKFQRDAATKAESKQGNEGGKNRDHAHDRMAVGQETLGFLSVRSFEWG